MIRDLQKRIAETQPRRKGIMLLTVLVVVAMIAVFLSFLSIEIRNQMIRSKQELQNAQVDLAAIAVATAPTTPESLALHDGRRITVEADRVTLTTPSGHPLAAAKRHRVDAATEETSE